MRYVFVYERLRIRNQWNKHRTNKSHARDSWIFCVRKNGMKIHFKEQKCKYFKCFYRYTILIWGKLFVRLSFPLRLSHVYCLLKSEMRNEAPEPSKIYADIDGENIRICYSNTMMHCVCIYRHASSKYQQCSSYWKKWKANKRRKSLNFSNWIIRIKFEWVYIDPCFHFWDFFRSLSLSHSHALGLLLIWLQISGAYTHTHTLTCIYQSDQAIY